MTTPLSEDFLLQLPKAELHCHLEGSVPAETAIRLARKNGVSLPTDDVEELYNFGDEFTLEKFLEVYVGVSNTMTTSADFAEVAYESLAAAASGGVKYREFAFNPSNHPQLSYQAMLEGLLDGMEAAHTDLRIDSRILVAINREQGSQVATDLVRTVIEQRHEKVLGIGLDHNEIGYPPELFEEAYSLAAQAGLKRTAHTGERGDSDEVRSALDVLKLDRVDHGYAVLNDRELLKHGQDTGTHFACCWSTAAVHESGQLIPEESIKKMIRAGLPVSISSDDPAIFGNHLGLEYIAAAEQLEWTAEDAEHYALAGVEASFLDPAAKTSLRDAFTAQIAQLKAAL